MPEKEKKILALELGGSFSELCTPLLGGIKCPRVIGCLHCG